MNRHHLALFPLCPNHVQQFINNATEGGTKKRQAAQPLRFRHVGWSDGIDKRVIKSVSATYPINHRVLMRIGELNGGGCSGALIGRRLVLTAAHCIVRPDLTYNPPTPTALAGPARGHSGSPNWTDYPGEKGPYVIGIEMWEHCFDCKGATGDIKTHPNGYRGMTHYLANFITDKRVAYP